MQEEFKTAEVDNEEYYLVPTADYELVDEDDDYEEESNDMLKGAVAGAAAVGVLALLGFGTKKLINKIRNRKKVPEVEEADYEVTDVETTEVKTTEVKVEPKKK